MSAAALRAGLEEALGRDVAVLARSPLADASSFPVERLEVVAGGERLSLVFKDFSPDSRPGRGTLAKPTLVIDPGREIEAYRQVLGPAAVDAPRCHGSIHDPDGGRFWLFLEHVRGELLWRIGDLEVWEAAARWLADLHSRAVPADGAGLLRYDAGWFRTWLPRAADAQGGASLGRLSARWERVVDRLSEWPLSLVHGEFYPSNVLIQQAGSSFRVRPVDWEMTGIGPGLLDLAALTGGDWTEDRRHRVVAAYFEAWPERLPRPQWQDFADALDHCRLHLAVQWAGWLPGWSPPPHHAQDWPREALSLAGELGI